MYGELHSCSTCSSRMIWFRMAGLISRWISCGGSEGGSRPGFEGAQEEAALAPDPQCAHGSFRHCAIRAKALT